MELLESFFGVIGDLTWGWALVPFLVVLGVFFTIISGFVQFKYFIRMFRVLSSRNQSGDPIPSPLAKLFYFPSAGGSAAVISQASLSP